MNKNFDLGFPLSLASNLVIPQDLRMTQNQVCKQPVMKKKALAKMH